MNFFHKTVLFFKRWLPLVVQIGSQIYFHLSKLVPKKLFLHYLSRLVPKINFLHNLSRLVLKYTLKLIVNAGYQVILFNFYRPCWLNFFCQC